MSLAHIFTVFIYQPFFNILVFFYWLIGLSGKPDMGIAVIFLTILVRILLMPLSLAGQRSEKDRRAISKKMLEIESEFEADPIEKERHKKLILKQNRGVLISELINLAIQVLLALMLWRIFAKGLPGEDLHLIYSFMPDVHLPFNLMFIGKYDLSHPHVSLNLLQSFLIFILETLSMYTSPFPFNKKEVVRLQLILPLVSFLVFMALPAGKKLFVITTLIFSICMLLYRAGQRWIADMQEKFAKKQEEKNSAAEPPIVQTIE